MCQQPPHCQYSDTLRDTSVVRRSPGVESTHLGEPRHPALLHTLGGGGGASGGGGAGGGGAGGGGGVPLLEETGSCFTMVGSFSSFPYFRRSVLLLRLLDAVLELTAQSAS